MPKGEPRNETEAQEMKRFLQRGGKADLKSLRRLQSRPAELRHGRPSTLQIPEVIGVADEVKRKEPGGGGATKVDKVAILELEFEPPSIAPSFSVNVFVNRPDANDKTPATGPTFVGSFAFFCHAQLRNGEPVCMDHGDGPNIFRLPVPASALRAAGRRPLDVTLVPVAFERRKPSPPLPVKATLDLSRSEFTPPA